MQFERGKDPKITLKIGIRELAKQILVEILENSLFGMYDDDLETVIKRRIKNELGVDVEVKMDFEKNQIFVSYSPTVKKIKHKITIKNTGSYGI